MSSYSIVHSIGIWYNQEPHHYDSGSRGQLVTVTLYLQSGRMLVLGSLFPFHSARGVVLNMTSSDLN